MDPIAASRTWNMLSQLAPRRSHFEHLKWPHIRERATSERDRGLLGLVASPNLLPGDNSEPQLQAQREFLVPSIFAGAAAGALIARLITNNGSMILAGAGVGGVVIGISNYAIDRLIYGPIQAPVTAPELTATSAPVLPAHQQHLSTLATHLTVAAQAGAVIALLNTVVGITVADLVTSNPALRSVLRTVPAAVPALCAALLTAKSIQAKQALKALQNPATGNAVIDPNKNMAELVGLESGTSSTVGSTIGDSSSISDEGSSVSNPSDSSNDRISLLISDSDDSESA